MNSTLPKPSAARVVVPSLFGASAGAELTLTVPKRRPSTVALVGCRVFNVVLAAVMLAVLLPVMLAVALAVRLSSPGPVLYSQLRVGIDRRGPRAGGGAARRRVDHGGRLFRIYKFRTMRADAPAGAQMWARPDDARVTRVGRLLRKYRLDELPQLWNVLRGDMNVVGPRPEQPDIFHTLREQIDDYPHRQRVLPGITGLAQVSQPYDCCVDDVRRKLRFDLQYIERMSPAQDLAILLRTVPVVLGRKGAW